MLQPKSDLPVEFENGIKLHYYKPFSVHIFNPYLDQILISIQIIKIKAPNAQIRIYSPFGKLIYTYILPVSEKTTYSLAWNGFDEKNNKISNGKYSYLIVYGTDTESGQFIFVGSSNKR